MLLSLATTAKYFYNFWRPVTAIRAADSDRNFETVADPNWLPWGIPSTPRHPDYVSTHSIGGGAAAEVLADAFSDDQSFRFTTPTAVNGEVRSYSSFSQAAAENSNSRVYMGFHFRKACRDGQRAGRHIGHFLSRHILKPLKPVKGAALDIPVG